MCMISEESPSDISIIDVGFTSSSFNNPEISLRASGFN